MWILICIFKLPFSKKPLSQTEHLKGRSPVWIFIRLFKMLFRDKPLSSTEHLCGRSPLWVLMCILMFVEVKSTLHILHLQHICLSITFLCLFNSIFIFVQFSPDAHLYFESCSWDWCFKIDIIFIVKLLLDRICPTGLLDCSTKTNNKKLFSRNSKLKIFNNFENFMNPEFKRVNVNFVCFCSSVVEQTGLPFVK